MTLLLTVALVLATALLAAVAAAAVLGSIGAATGATLERCDRCHRVGLAEHGTVHGDGCPQLVGRPVAGPSCFSGAHRG